MKVLFVHDTYYAQNKDGETYAFGAFPYSLWEERFLPHFDEITVIGREKEFDSEDIQGQPRSDGENVSFHLLPNINSPLTRLFGSKDVVQQIKKDVRAHDLVIIRGPVEFGMIAAAAAREFNKQYVVEMSGCAYDHTHYHGSNIGKVYAPIKMRRARKMVWHADAVIYVTQNFLQMRYPTKGHQAAASNVEIAQPPVSVLENRLVKIETYKLPLQICLMGNYGNHLKGVGIALKALGQIKDNIPPFEFRVLGKGDPNLWKEYVRDANLQGRAFFEGPLEPGEPVLNWLDQLDFYIQPSFHEGLPRALIEALSRGLPALASDAGGTEELLKPEHIHTRGNVAQLAEQLEKYIGDKVWMKEQAHLNFDTAKLYSREMLLPIRQNFWSDVRKMVKSRWVN